MAYVITPAINKAIIQRNMLLKGFSHAKIQIYSDMTATWRHCNNWFNCSKSASMIQRSVYSAIRYQTLSCIGYKTALTHFADRVFRKWHLPENASYNKSPSITPGLTLLSPSYYEDNRGDGVNHYTLAVGEQNQNPEFFKNRKKKQQKKYIVKPSNSPPVTCPMSSDSTIVANVSVFDSLSLLQSALRKILRRVKPLQEIKSLDLASTLKKFDESMPFLKPYMVTPSCYDITLLQRTCRLLLEARHKYAHNTASHLLAPYDIVTCHLIMCAAFRLMTSFRVSVSCDDGTTDYTEEYHRFQHVYLLSTSHMTEQLLHDKSSITRHIGQMESLGGRTLSKSPITLNGVETSVAHVRITCPVTIAQFDALRHFLKKTLQIQWIDTRQVEQPVITYTVTVDLSDSLPTFTQLLKPSTRYNIAKILGKKGPTVIIIPDNNGALGKVKYVMKLNERSS